MNVCFLRETLESILNKYDFNLQNITIVLPSKRSIVFSKHYLKQIFKDKKKTSFFPQLCTPDYIVQNISGISPLQKVDLIYKLYQSYVRVSKNKEEVHPYHVFVKWAPTLLNDFNDVLISHPTDTEKQKLFFTNLKDIKEIEQWSLNNKELSENQERYLNLMQSFYDIFINLNSTLIKQQNGYTGLILNEAIHRLKSQKEISFIQATDTFIFIGLNAVNPAENIIYKYLKQINKAEFYLDYDSFYTTETEHEAGYFINETLHAFSINRDTKESFFKSEKAIHICSVESNIDQALYIRSILEQLRKDNPNLENTAIVVPDSSLLWPLMSAIPEDIEYNVSMEYPIAHTPVYQFIQNYIFTCMMLEKKANLIYHTQLSQILMNPFFKNYLYYTYDIPVNTINKFLNEVQRKNKIYISIIKDNLFEAQEFEKIKEALQIFIEANISSNIVIIQTIINVLEKYISKLFSNQKNNIQITMAQSILQHLYRIKDILAQDQSRVFQSIKDLYTIVSQIVGKESIAFSGEPLKGLQILGVLETRLLDFETIIWTSMNEKIMPANSFKHSFIPYDLRKHFNLPTYEHYDAIAAYYFYRSIQRAKQIYLTYSSATSSESIGEESRFIKQIKFELADKPNIHTYFYTIQNNIKINTSSTISIKKDEKIINQLYNLTYTPTSFTTYINCPLKFYFQYILNIKEKEELSEDLESNTKGVIFHSIMQKIYSVIRGKIIDPQALEQIIQSNIIETLIELELAVKNFELKGTVLIQKEILLKEINKFLKAELKLVQQNQISILSLEEQSEIFTIPTSERDIQFKGIPDRIDFVWETGVLRVIDYKSSFSAQDNLQLDFSTLFNATDREKSNTKLIQLLIYILSVFANKRRWTIYNQTHKQVIVPEQVTGYIAALTVKQSENNNRYFQITNTGGGIQLFDEPTINTLINAISLYLTNEILNPDKEFKQTENINLCKYCTYNYFCQRNVPQY